MDAKRLAGLANLHGGIAADVVGKLKGPGELRCNRCGTSRSISTNAVAEYLARGWPKCCGATMEWVTERKP